MGLIPGIDDLFSSGGGGGGGGMQQTSSTTASIPDELKPIVNTYAGQGADLFNLSKNPFVQYQGQQVAGFSPLQLQAFNNIQAMTPPDQMGQAMGLAGAAGTAAGNIGSTYNQIQGSGPNFYNAPNQTVSAGTVTNQNVNAPNVNTFQMSQPANVTSQQVGSQQVTAPGGLQTFQMGPAQQVGTQDYTGANVSRYMDPYMQQVVQQQKNQAISDYAESLPQLGSAATAVGGLGGSRQALMAAKAQQGLQEKLAGIQAAGSQAAFQNAQQQFNQQQQANLQAALANQQAGLTVGQQNLTSQQATQQLSAQQQLQAALANQQASQQAALANQQTGLQAALANQQTGYQTGVQNLNAQQTAQQLAAQTGLQAQQANQQANMQAQQLNQASGLQAALANQQANLQQNQLAAQYGLAGAQLAQQSQQFGANLGLQGLQAQLQAAGQLGNLGNLLYGQNTGINQAQLLAGAQQQAQNQNILNNAYQNWQNLRNYPIDMLKAASSIASGSPAASSSTTYGQTPSTMSQLAGTLLGAYGLGNAFGWFNNPGTNPGSTQGILPGT